MLDVPHCPLDLKFNVGPVTVDNLRTLVAPGSLIPVELTMPDPVSASGTITGTLQDMVIAAGSDLSGYRVLYRAAAISREQPLTLNVTGKNTVRGTVSLIGAAPSHDLTATMSQVGLKFESAQLPAVSDLNATVHLTPKRLVVEPASFTVGAGHASLAGDRGLDNAAQRCLHRQGGLAATVADCAQPPTR